MLYLLTVGCLPWIVPSLTTPTDTSEPVSSCWTEVAETGNHWTEEWPISTPSTLVGEGFAQGQVPPDMCMLDQHGDKVSLWQFYGNVILLDVSAEWCAPCQELAEEVDETWEDYKDQGFMYLTLLTENYSSQIPELSSLEHWAEQHEITAPVLSDSEGYKRQLVPNGAYPKLLLIDRTMKVAVENINPQTDAAIRAVLEDEL